MHLTIKTLRKMIREEITKRKYSRFMESSNLKSPQIQSKFWLDADDPCWEKYKHLFANNYQELHKMYNDAANAPATKISFNDIKQLAPEAAAAFERQAPEDEDINQTRGEFYIVYYNGPPIIEGNLPGEQWVLLTDGNFGILRFDEYTGFSNVQLEYDPYEVAWV